MQYKPQLLAEKSSQKISFFEDNLKSDEALPVLSIRPARQSDELLQLRCARIARERQAGVLGPPLLGEMRGGISPDWIEEDQVPRKSQQRIFVEERAGRLRDVSRSHSWIWYCQELRYLQAQQASMPVFVRQWRSDEQRSDAG